MTCWFPDAVNLLISGNSLIALLIEYSEYVYW